MIQLSTCAAIEISIPFVSTFYVILICMLSLFTSAMKNKVCHLNDFPEKLITKVHFTLELRFLEVKLIHLVVLICITLYSKDKIRVGILDCLLGCKYTIDNMRTFVSILLQKKKRINCNFFSQQKYLQMTFK